MGRPSKTELRRVPQKNNHAFVAPSTLIKKALSLVDIERPEDPISYIAMYILKNKNQVKLPQAPS